MEVQMWPLGRIVVQDRARRDVGDLSDLKESLTRLGQLQPISARPDGTLVFGERRFRAAEQLGWSEIAVYMFTLDSAEMLLRAELDENTCRKGLTPVEAAQLRKKLAELIEPEMKKRQQEAGEHFGRGIASGNLPQPIGRGEKTRDLAAKPTGYAARTLDKVDEILDAAEDPEEDEEVREEAQKQAEALSKAEAKVAPAHAAVKRTKERVQRKKKPHTHQLLPGQQLQQPDRRPRRCPWNDG